MRVLLVAAAALVLAAPAGAGGSATAGLAPPPKGIGAGDTWRAEVTILQHGITPLEGAKPAVIIRDADGNQKRFAAKPTDRPGVYVANVEFPHGGTWKYLVYDGFEAAYPQTHSFASFEVAEGTGGAGDAGLPRWVLAAAVAIALLAAVFLLARRLRPAAAPATN